MSEVRPVPEGFATISAYLIVPEVGEAIEFYEKAFGFQRGEVLPGPDGAPIHAELRLGDSTLMMSAENPRWGAASPRTLGGSPVTIHLYVDDVDALFERATAAGCEVVYPLEDTFWGDRYAKLTDPFGHSWSIGTHMEDLSGEEITRRAREWFAAAAERRGEGS